MAALVLALDANLEDRLLADLVEAGHDVLARLVGWRDVVESLDGLAPDVVLAGGARGTLSAELLQACDRRGIRLVVLAADDRERALAGRLGLHEVLDADADWREVDRLVRGGLPVPRARAAPHTARVDSCVIAVWGPCGAPGRTTLAVNVAAELAATGARVALVDADPYGGAVATALGLLDEAPGFAAACRLAGSASLDRTELDRVARRYSSARGAFDVFTGLVGPSRWPELSADRVTAALTALRAWSEFVVVDTGFSLERDEELTSDQFAPRRNAATFSSLAVADRVVAVGLADPIGLSRLVRGHAELLELVDADRLEVVVNRVRSATLGIDAHGQIRHTLRRFAGIPEVTLLPHDGRATDAAILGAKTLRDAAPRSALRGAIREFVAVRLASGRLTTDRFTHDRATAERGAASAAGRRRPASIRGRSPRAAGR